MNIKTTLLVLILMPFLSCSTYKPVTNSGRDITVQVFYDELSPYGYWVHNREYGYVWIPHEGDNFFPYVSDGHWIMTHYGWTWVSDFQWGWAPFHYGRWDFDPYYGWFWFPGEEWGPAWVIWRHGGGYYGWAPMGPESSFKKQYYFDDLYRWVFVREEDFGKPHINRYYVGSRKKDEIFRKTSILVNSQDGSDGFYSAGPDPREIERVTRRSVSNIALRDIETPGRRLKKDELELYRPRVQSKPQGMRPAPQIITDIEGIRPAGERKKKYQSEESVLYDDDQKDQGQGNREINREKIQNDRERDVRRKYEKKQSESQEKIQSTEQIQKQRVSDEERKRQNVEKEYRQNQTERKQATERQRKIMEKERKTGKSEKDTSTTRRIEREQSGNLKRK